ncbi:hypothetical protein MVEN_02320000 [Mycena venus]|uniref:Cyanovirin-N domain-containing protein n=1 Tax=Mycena venus TaxID=2733690 RepID=A0A8H6X456_9AGAR|nr:hypothetical protein MVEN_02320000 [Mycena venus]
MVNFGAFLIVAATAFTGVNSVALPASGTDVGPRAAGQPAIRGNAAASCTLWSLVPDTVNLIASCDDRTGGHHITEIEISACVGNQDGHIACQKGGGAGDSCVFFDIHFSSSFFTISAHCKNRASGTVTTDNFNMNACLTNDNGNLVC